MKAGVEQTCCPSQEVPVAAIVDFKDDGSPYEIIEFRFAPQHANVSGGSDKSSQKAQAFDATFNRNMDGNSAKFSHWAEMGATFAKVVFALGPQTVTMSQVAVTHYSIEATGDQTPPIERIGLNASNIEFDGARLRND